MKDSIHTLTRCLLSPLTGGSWDGPTLARRPFDDGQQWVIVIIYRSSINATVSIANTEAHLRVAKLSNWINVSYKDDTEPTMTAVLYNTTTVREPWEGKIRVLLVWQGLRVRVSHIWKSERALGDRGIISTNIVLFRYERCEGSHAYVNFFGSWPRKEWIILMISDSVKIL